LDPDVDAGEAEAPGTGQTSSAVPWPAGPHYWNLTRSDGGVAWVRYRIWSADWHTRTMEELSEPHGSFDREVGIEMALDGALNGLSSAFDAGVTLLIRAVETARDLDIDDRMSVHLYNWERCRDMLRQAGIANEDVWRLILDVDNALAGESQAFPDGWLAQLRRLRNRVAHQDSLARIHEVGGINVTGLSIRGQRVDAFEFLASLCDRVYDLSEQMIEVAVAIGARETLTPWNRARWNALDD
jgi:hypothetical protein